MKFTVPHAHSEAEGIARVKQLLDENRKKIEENASDVKTEWAGNTLHFAFSAQGQHIEGTLTVCDQAFEVYAKLPLTLRLFEGTIERMIQAEIQKMKV